MPKISPAPERSFRDELYSDRYTRTIDRSRSLLGKIANINVIGLENIPQEGPAIIVPNHTEFLDILITGVALDIRASFLAKKSLARYPFVGNYITNGQGTILIDRKNPEMASLREMKAVVDQEQPLVVFGEGTRNKKNRKKVQTFLTGAATVARWHGNVGLNPVGLAKGPKSLHRKFEIAVVAGEPIPDEEIAIAVQTYGKRAADKIITERLHASVQECVDRAYELVDSAQN